jgi:RNA recognition motif-containing protein
MDLSLGDVMSSEPLKRLYVGNLPFQIAGAELAQLFGAHGSVVSATIVTDRDSGRSRGFAFVEMATAEQAQAAVAALDGAKLEGRALQVTLARPREDRGVRRS